MALLSDLTREQNRTKAMAFIGVSFGVTFAIAMVLGPLLPMRLVCTPVLDDCRAGDGRDCLNPVGGAGQQKPRPEP